MREFEEYKKLGEPEKAKKSEIWQTAIGLQQVDGLVPSQYLIETARENIEGYITIDEVKNRLNSYYKEKPADNDKTEEADKVSAHIAEILSESTFTFSPAELITIHKRLFMGIYKFAGKIRDYNISKEEWVLDGASVLYASANSIQATLDYDFAQEKAFSYKGLSARQKVEHIVDFVSRIWQIHPFGEGNTRTTAVFTIKYLRSLGFNVTNLFAEHSWYFRNALVRANYNDYNNDIFSTDEYLFLFFGNLLLGENNELHNRNIHIKSKNDEENVGVNVGVSVGVKLNVTESAVLQILQNSPDITATELSAQIGKSTRTIERTFASLKEKGYIERIGSDKTGFWKVLNK